MAREAVALALAGAALVVGVGVWLVRKDGGPSLPVSPPPVIIPPAPARPRHVYHDEKAHSCVNELRAAIEAYEGGGPLPITLTDGLRQGPKDAARQAQYFATGKSGAKTLDQTPHGRGGAIDFAVVREVVRGVVKSVWPSSERPELYKIVGEWFEERGLIWGGRWTAKFGEGGDSEHIEVKGWIYLPYPPKGAIA